MRTRRTRRTNKRQRTNRARRQTNKLWDIGKARMITRTRYRELLSKKRLTEKEKKDLERALFGISAKHFNKFCSEFVKCTELPFLYKFKVSKLKKR